MRDIEIGRRREGRARQLRRLRGGGEICQKEWDSSFCCHKASNCRERNFLQKPSGKPRLTDLNCPPGRGSDDLFVESGKMLEWLCRDDTDVVSGFLQCRGLFNYSRIRLEVPRRYDTDRVQDSLRRP